MEVLDAIYTRRSIRSFLGKKIDKKLINKVIDAGIHAPSACDIQGWRFIVIDDEKIKEKIVSKGAASFIKNAPVGILVLYNNQSDNVEYKDYIQSAAAAIQNIHLTAHSLGIGSCWICHLPSKKQLRKLLKIPFIYDPIAYIVLGYYDIKPNPRKRRNKLKDLISYNKYSLNEKIPSKFNTRLTAKRIARKLYYKIPFRNKIKPVVDDLFEKRFD